MRFAVALGHAPDFAHAHWNLALALLAHGDYPEGWREYEWRLHLPELGARAPALPAPRWQGEPLSGKTLLATTEQGLGDAIQFVRYASALASRGARVIVQAPGPLQRLLASVPGVAATFGTNDALPACDFAIPLLSVPGELGVGANDRACAVPYLRVDAARRADIATPIAQVAGSSRKIGLAWAGSPHHANDRRRSLPLSALAPLFALPGVSWFSLQKGEGVAQVALVPAAASALTLLDPHNEFDDTAALVDALDVIVTVDTSIAHLAGALGKRVLILLPFAPDWRWGTTGDTTPWYPTARLFRQRTTGDWASAVTRWGGAGGEALTRPLPQAGEGWRRSSEHPHPVPIPLAGEGERSRLAKASTGALVSNSRLRAARMHVARSPRHCGSPARRVASAT